MRVFPYLNDFFFYCNIIADENKPDRTKFRRHFWNLKAKTKKKLQ